MKNVVFATGNKHKLEEVKAIFKDLPFQIYGWDDVFEEAFDVDENGSTFEENALKKLEHLPSSSSIDIQLEDCIFMADDSGIEVEALDGRPGIYSARYTEEGTSESWCKKLLGELNGLNNRTANFTAAIAIKYPSRPRVGEDTPFETHVCMGKVFGTITESVEAGAHGFGYDPVFIPKGFSETFAQMKPSQKNKLSHRYKALMLAKHFLEHQGS